MGDQAMDENAEKGRFNWRLPLYAAAVALVVLLPISIYDPDMGLSFYVFIVVPGVSIILGLFLFLFWTYRQRPISRSVLLMFPVFWLVTFVSMYAASAIRTPVRWLLYSKHYKAETLAQPAAQNGEMKHIEWQGWGFPGAGDTVVYLVYDPNDALSGPAAKRSPGMFHGIPCEVYRVRRLESHWYTVLFYTDTDWQHCP
jgi:hypothetical protein